MKHILSFAAATATLASGAAAQWHSITTATNPSNRAESAIAFDSSTNRSILFGGVPSFGNPFADTWSYDGSNWTLLTPATSPTRRGQAGMVYDANRGVCVMYGGGNITAFGGPSINQTWEFDGTSWTQIITTHSPGGLAVFGMAYDSLRNRVVVHGGLPDSFFPIDSASTWEYDGLDWTLQAPVTSPGPLERPAMCFHQGIGKTVLFGGIDVQIGGTDTTWTWDGTNWAALTIAGAKPSVRTGAKMVYDPARGVCVLHGGQNPNTGALITDTWEFDGTAWTPINAGVPSPARSGVAMTMDTTRRAVVIRGGYDANFNVLGGTFEYGAYYAAFGSGCAGSNGVPTLASTSQPRIGSNFTLQIGNLAPAAGLAFVVLGLSNSSSQLGALPADLSVIGMPGCTAYVSSDSLTAVVSSGGNAGWSLSIPNAPWLIGLPFYNQAVSLDAGINAAGLTVSNAGAGVVGG